MVSVGAFGPALCTVSTVVSTPPESWPKTLRPPGPLIGRDADVEVADVRADVDGASVESLGVADLRQVDHEVAGVEVVAALHVGGHQGPLDLLVRVPLVDDRRTGRDHGRDQADQDEAAGPTPEGADEEEDTAQRQHQGGVRRGGDRRAGEVDDAEDAECDGHHGQREPEEDRPLLAGVHRPRLLDVHGRGGIGPGLALAAGAGVADAVAGDRAGRRRRALGRGSAAVALRELGRDQGDDAGDDQEDPRVAAAPPGMAGQDHQDEQADEHERHGAAAPVEGHPAPVAALLGEEQPARDVEEEPGSAEEGQDDEGDPHDQGVDVEVAGQTARDTRDTAVTGRTPDPAQVADVVPADART
jgi:hypothetical protein